MSNRRMVGFLAAVLMVCLFSGLSRAGDNAQKQADNLVIFPPPPDSVRIQFLTRISTSTDITGKRSGLLRYILGEMESKPIGKPYGLAIHDGKIYICDTKLGCLEIIDLAKHSFEYFKPGGLGQLRKPINCFVDTNGYLYVADVERRQVVLFNNQNQYISSIGNPAESKPTDVFVTGDKIWVNDLESHAVKVYDKTNHDMLFTFPEADKRSPEYLYSPTNLLVTNDKVFVSDLGDFKIKTFSLEGDYLNSIGSYGPNVGQFTRPKGIALDKDENLYVVDAGFENVQVFNNSGNLLMFFGGNYQGPGFMWLPAKVVIDYDNLQYFSQYVDNRFNLKYLIMVTNQFGPDKVSVYGFVEPK